MDDVLGLPAGRPTDLGLPAGRPTDVAVGAGAPPVEHHEHPHQHEHPSLGSDFILLPERPACLGPKPQPPPNNTPTLPTGHFPAGRPLDLGPTPTQGPVDPRLKGWSWLRHATEPRTEELCRFVHAEHDISTRDARLLNETVLPQNERLERSRRAENRPRFAPVNERFWALFPNSRFSLGKLFLHRRRMATLIKFALVTLILFFLSVSTAVRVEGGGAPPHKNLRWVFFHPSFVETWTMLCTVIFFLYVLEESLVGSDWDGSEQQAFLADFEEKQEEIKNRLLAAGFVAPDVLAMARPLALTETAAEQPSQFLFGDQQLKRSDRSGRGPKTPAEYLLLPIGYVAGKISERVLELAKSNEHAPTVSEDGAFVDGKKSLERERLENLINSRPAALQDFLEGKSLDELTGRIEKIEEAVPKIPAARVAKVEVAPTQAENEELFRQREQTRKLQERKKAEKNYAKRFREGQQVLEVTQKNLDSEIEVMLYAAKHSKSCVVSSLSVGFSISGKLPTDDLPAFSQNYASLRDNMNHNSMKLVSLSFALVDENGKFPIELDEVDDSVPGCLKKGTPLVWKFNFRFSRVRDLVHRNELNSWFLDESLVSPSQWNRHESEGLSIAQFSSKHAPRLKALHVKWIAYDGYRDYAAFLKVARGGQPLPQNVMEFHKQLDQYFPNRVDLKHLVWKYGEQLSIWSDDELKEGLALEGEDGTMLLGDGLPTAGAKKGEKKRGVSGEEEGGSEEEGCEQESLTRGSKKASQIVKVVGTVVENASPRMSKSPKEKSPKPDATKPDEDGGQTGPDGTLARTGSTPQRLTTTPLPSNGDAVDRLTSAEPEDDSKPARKNLGQVLPKDSSWELDQWSFAETIGAILPQDLKEGHPSIVFRGTPADDCILSLHVVKRLNLFSSIRAEERGYAIVRDRAVFGLNKDYTTQLLLASHPRRVPQTEPHLWDEACCLETTFRLDDCRRFDPHPYQKSTAQKTTPDVMTTHTYLMHLDKAGVAKGNLSVLKMLLIDQQQGAGAGGPGGGPGGPVMMGQYPPMGGGVGGPTMMSTVGGNRYAVPTFNWGGAAMGAPPGMPGGPPGRAGPAYMTVGGPAYSDPYGGPTHGAWVPAQQPQHMYYDPEEGPPLPPHYRTAGHMVVQQPPGVSRFAQQQQQQQQQIAAQQQRQQQQIAAAEHAKTQLRASTQPFVPGYSNPGPPGLGPAQFFDADDAPLQQQTSTTISNEGEDVPPPPPGLSGGASTFPPKLHAHGAPPPHGGPPVGGPHQQQHPGPPRAPQHAMPSPLLGTSTAQHGGGPPQHLAPSPPGPNRAPPGLSAGPPPGLDAPPGLDLQETTLQHAPPGLSAASVQQNVGGGPPNKFPGVKGGAHGGGQQQHPGGVHNPGGPPGGPQLVHGGQQHQHSGSHGKNGGGSGARFGNAKAPPKGQGAKSGGKFHGGGQTPHGK